MVDPKTKEKCTYYRCQCGVLFQGEFKERDNEQEYIEDFGVSKDSPRYINHAQHSGRIYAPLIEELGYGRKMLEVGHKPYNTDFFSNRGWITWQTDSDLTTFNNEVEVPAGFIEETSVHREYNLIWINHSIEKFKDPIASLKKAYDLLSPEGCLFIATPDIDFINKTGVQSYPHFRNNKHYVMWNERALKRELEKIGFKVVMARRNFSSRFISWYDVHIIAQKDYF